MKTLRGKQRRQMTFPQSHHQEAMVSGSRVCSPARQKNTQKLLYRVVAGEELGHGAVEAPRGDPPRTFLSHFSPYLAQPPKLQATQGLRPWLTHIFCIPAPDILPAAQIAIELHRTVRILEYLPQKSISLGSWRNEAMDKQEFG